MPSAISETDQTCCLAAAFSRGIVRPLVLAWVVMPLAGCLSAPDKHELASVPPDFSLPEKWVAGAEAYVGDVRAGWIKSFNDPRLERLVAEAMASNRDLRATAARLQAARETTIVSRAERFPSLSAGLDGGRVEVAPRAQDGTLGDFQGSNDYRIYMNATWELDLWGRLANLDRAARADYENQAADYQAAQLSLAANTVKAWFALLTARQQVALAEKTRESFERNLRIVERNYRAGDSAASPLDVQFSRTQLSAAERGLSVRRLGLEESKRTLEILLGRYPAALVEGKGDLPPPSPRVPAGLPSSLLMRRPDLVAAASEVLATSERAAAARKSLLPSISLTASGSTLTSESLVDLINDPASIGRSVAASLVQPLFRGGSLKAQARQAAALNEAAIHAFQEQALTAFREVESALAAEQSLTDQYRSLLQEVEQAELAETQAARDYSEGIVGYLSVLEAQRRAFDSRSALINLRNARLQDRVDLFLALGGDFRQP
ncbi:MAG: efflux transporter outer membrane subunit [Verrucomicrobiales bacterium]